MDNDKYKFDIDISDELATCISALSKEYDFPESEIISMAIHIGCLTLSDQKMINKYHKTEKSILN